MKQKNANNYISNVKIKHEYLRKLQLIKEKTKQSYQGQVELALNNWFELNGIVNES